MDALENLASIDAHLTIGVRYVGTVAHETATLDILSSNIHRRNRTARRRRIEVLQGAEKDRISINQQRLNATPNKALECHVNVALAVGVSHNEFKPECTRRGMQLRHNSLDVGISGIDEEADYSCGGDEFAQHLKPFRRERHLHKADAGDIAARSVEALNKTKADRVGANVEYDGDCRSGIPRGCQRCRPTNCNDKGNLPVDQIRRERGQPIKLALGPAKLHRQVTAFHKSGFAQPSANCGYVFSIWRRRRS